MVRCQLALLCFLLGTQMLAAQQNRVRYTPPSTTQTRTSNRVTYPGRAPLAVPSPKEEEPVSTQDVVETIPVKAPLPEATPQERREILSLLAPYTKTAPVTKVNDAFYRLSPGFGDFLQLFRQQAQSEKAFHEYTELYENAFHKDILRKFYGLDISRTRIYQTSLLVYAPTHWQSDQQMIDFPVLRAEFFWPEDPLEVLSNYPIITLLFVKLASGYKIFHPQALVGLKIKPN